jgi:hypothetical protein
MSDFWAKYRDPRWQQVRLRIMERDGWKCCDCGSTDDTLQVHHGYYERDTAPWNYPEWSLRTLCEVCHDIRHDQQRELLKAAVLCDPRQMDFLLGYAKAEATRCKDTQFMLDNDEQMLGAMRVFGDTFEHACNIPSERCRVVEFRDTMTAITKRQNAKSYERFCLERDLLAEA